MYPWISNPIYVEESVSIFWVRDTMPLYLFSPNAINFMLREACDGNVFCGDFRIRRGEVTKVTDHQVMRALRQTPQTVR